MVSYTSLIPARTPSVSSRSKMPCLLSSIPPICDRRFFGFDDDFSLLVVLRMLWRMAQIEQRDTVRFPHHLAGTEDGVARNKLGLSFPGG